MTSVNQTALPQAEPLLRITDLTVDYRIGGFGRKRTFRALQGVSLDIKPGETLGLVGESGSGKSTIGRAVLGLAPVTGGDIRFDGRSITRLSKKERRALSSDVQVVFQDPYTSLNPSMTISDILSEPMQVSGTSKVDAQRRVRELLDVVNLPSNASTRYPREFSGGQRQRIAIARSLCRHPKLIVCDEPVSALDLSTQARVLQLFSDIQEQTGVSLLFVTHDLDVVRHISERVAVMRRGEIVETGTTERVIAEPQHAYTKALLLASPIANPARQANRRRERRLFLDAQAALSTAAR
ncbi:ATP-binding cassette domain-containing protein [Arthrobacter sp. Leaf137]|uniref:ATP-binding cassette domain-containing protein n=1 Tax=Arthrobacter sp. Leaf137 TaxID=1736271 RepID=UPI0006F60DA3|nr:ATP-binding cassette domain-containing protein [Arthrobacter sp. Leaf137]KQQ85105.1 peptide ABC transporter ATP-binding protein [Arthrobacter sp. Leaf137]